jgi:hypothetical protein
MNTLWCSGLAVGFASVMLLGRVGTAQPPPPHPVVEALDADGDGTLSGDEIKGASESLKSLDKNNDGTIAGDELHPRGGPGGRGRPGAAGQRPAPGGPDERGGPDGPGGRPRPEPGEVLPRFLRDRLELTDDQEKQLTELENDARGRLAKILTSEQKKTLDGIRDGESGRPPLGGRDAVDSPQGRPKKKAAEKPRRPEGASRPEQPKGEQPAQGEARANQVGIQWFATWEGGLRAAEQTGRPILLVSAAPHCSGVPGIW